MHRRTNRTQFVLNRLWISLFPCTIPAISSVNLFSFYLKAFSLPELPHSVALVNFLLIISSPNWNEFFNTVSHSLTLCTFFVAALLLRASTRVSLLHRGTINTLFCFHFFHFPLPNPALNLLDSS